MKTLLLKVLTAILLLIIPQVNFGQSPNLGTTSSFALFTAVGAFNNDGASAVKGDVGTNVGAFNAFPPGVLIGTKHVADPASVQAAKDVANAYSDLFGMTPTDVIGVSLGNGQVIAPGVHKIGAAATLNGNLILDGKGNPDAIFIFQIDGALATGTSSNVTLTNSASLCNVYWQINGQFDLGSSSVFRGTIIANGAINLLEGSSLLGRGLSKAGAISLHNNIVINPVTEAPIVTLTQPTCILATGTITITSPKGTGLTYSIDGVNYTNTTGIFTKVPAGTYSVTAEIEGGCASSEMNVTVNAAPAAPAAPTVTLTQPTCILTTGTIKVTAPIGSGMTYSINGSTYANTAGLFTPLAPGTYNVTAKSADGCISSATILTLNAAPGAPAAPTATLTQPTCILTAGTIKITSPTGTGITYSINGSTYTNTTGLFTQLAPGTYNVTAKNADGCISAGTNETINAAPGAPAAPTATLTQPTCILITGTIKVTAPTGTGMTYSINGSNYTNTTGLFTQLAPGTYNVTAKNADGCISAGTNETINAAPGAPAAPTATLTQSTCILTTGTIKVTAPTGTGMTYSINGSNYTNTTGLFTLLAPGTYNVTAKNADGCISAGTNETINAAPGAPAAPDATLTQPTSCILTAGTIKVTAPTGTGMTYSINGSTYTNTTGLFTQLAPGTYNVTAKNADGCISSATIVTINAAPGAPAAPTATLTQPTCILTTGTIKVTTPTGTGMTYSINGSTYTNTTGIFTQLAPDTYNVTAKNADGCISAGTNETINAAPGAPEVTTPNKASICSSISTNISLTASLASSFTWTVGDVTGGITGASAGSGSTIRQILVNPNSTSKGTVEYIVIPAATTGLCVGSVGSPYTITVTVGPPATSPIIITAGGPTIICEGESVTLSGNNGGIWSNGATTPSITVYKSGDYFVTNTNDCGDVTSNHILVTVNPLPICTITYSVLKCSICVGQTMHLSAPAGYAAYLWSTGATTNHIDVTTKGTYYVTVTNSSGCISTCSLTVTVYPIPSAITGNDTTICKGNSVTLGTSPVSGNTYLWTPVAGLSSAIIANPVASPSVTTTYILTETNSKTGCQKKNSVTVTVNNVIGITTQPGNKTACIGGSVSFSVSSTGTGLTYQWRRGTVNLTNGGNISGATSATLIINPVSISNAASNYNVVITGVCSSTATSANASLEVNAAPSISTSACVGSSVSFSVAATGADLTYQWRKGDLILENGGNISGATSATLTINPVSITDASSDYNVVITGSCSPNSTTPNISLVVNSVTNIVTGPTDQTSCAGSSASFSVASIGMGLTYQWRRGTINLTNGGNISGATSATLIINPVNISDTASNYNVVVYGTCSSPTTSKVASLTLCTETGTTSFKVGNEAISIYPNPFRTTLNIIINDSMQFKKLELRLYDALGIIAYKTSISQKSTILETKSFPPGMYFYKISDNNKIIQSGKLVSRQ